MRYIRRTFVCRLSERRTVVYRSYCHFICSVSPSASDRPRLIVRVNRIIAIINRIINRIITIISRIINRIVTIISRIINRSYY